MSKHKPPLWMPLFVEKFLADTSGFSLAQTGAYINLLSAMWRSKGGSLPSDETTLARSGRVERKHWWRIWPAIKSLFEIDGDLATSADLQAELGKANAKIVMARAAAALGGMTSQFNRGHRRDPLTAHKPLKNNNGAQADAQADAQHEYNRNIKEEEERSGSTRPETVEPSLTEKEATREVVVEAPSSPTTSVPPENPSSSREQALQNWGQNLYNKRSRS